MSSKFNHRRTRVQHTPKICISKPPQGGKIPPVPPIPPTPTYYGEEFPWLNTCCVRPITLTALAIVTGPRGRATFEVSSNVGADFLGDGYFETGGYCRITVGCGNDRWDCVMYADYPDGEQQIRSFAGARGRCVPLYLFFGPIMGYTVDLFEL